MEATLHEPTKEEQQEARKASRELKSSIKNLKEKSGPHTIQFTIDDSTFSVPKGTVRLLTEYLESLAVGKSVSLLSLDAELSTRQAADILNVSRPHVVKLLEEGHIPFRTVGTHRRVKTKDVLEYRKEQEQTRDQALDNLAKQAQELNMGY